MTTPPIVGGVVSGCSNSCENADREVLILFGIKRRAEMMHLTDEEYQRGRRLMFKLKRRALVWDFVSFRVVGVILVILIGGAAQGLALLEHKHIAWDKLFGLLILIPPIPATIVAIANFVFRSPLAGLEQAKPPTMPDA